MRKPTVQTRYIEHLMEQIAFLQKQLELGRQDCDFYRGKVERLELAIMSNPPAQQEYVQTEIVQKPEIKNVKAPQIPPRIPFSDLKRQWMQLSAEEQEKAMQQGWQVEKEAANAGE